MERPDPPVDPGTTQSELERMNRLYAMLSHINRTIVRTDDPQELYANACRIAIEYGGFALAWIGLFEPGSDKVVPVASAGVTSAEHLKGVADIFRGLGPTASATRAERPFIVNDTSEDPRAGQWRNITELWGIRSGGSFPIRLEGAIIGAFNVAAADPNCFRDREVNLLVEVADDLSFALEVIRRAEKHDAAEAKMRYLAYYDTQTGLPTRVLFEERLAETRRDAAGGTVAVLVASLRRYHGILQLLGPEAGLEIIRSMAVRLQTALPATPIARVTESKFALTVSEPSGLDAVEELAWSAQRALAGPTHADGQELFLDPCVGIAVYPRDGEPADVLKRAMQAATAPARHSGDACRFYDSDLDDEGSRQRLNLDTALRWAIERGEFRLHYQPQVDLASGRIVGAEALLRWERPGHGLVSPLDFIPLLEDNGLIGAVGEWVLHEACRRSRQWQDEGLPPFRVAVNLSARQFHDGDIRAIVRRALDATELDARWLELELTEGIVLLNADAVIHTMHQLNAEGITHALDDFGTGYSSLSYLQRLPVARIKIDRSFVTHITSSPSDAAIAHAVVGMAHSLGLSVIAEGVETEGQLGFLRGIGCEEIQGYFFSQPLPEEEFAALLREGRGMPPGKANKPERVLLLVDDEPNILSSLTRVLRRKGYRIFSTTSTREGFDLMAAHRPGVVICDQRMPEMNGTEFLRRVKELHPDTVRIVLSGYTDLSAVIDAVNQGAVYKFLTKPWEDEVLCEIIEDAFRIYELSHENRELSRRLQVQQTTGNKTH